MESRFETEEDLKGLIGQYESVRLDFKASELLAQPKERIIKQLAEDTSAFANTEGGVIVIGIREGKHGKKSVAVEIDDGVDPTQFSPEWLEQLIASNISPAIFGLTVRPVPLSGSRAGRVAYVVAVPKGTTAHQARHSLLYYGRTEFAAVPLADNVIRLLMTRGQVAHAVVEIAEVSRVTAEEEYKDRQMALAAREKGSFLARDRRAFLEAPKSSFDEYKFSFAIRNNGLVTIRDCLLSVSICAAFSVKLADGSQADPPWLLPLSAQNRTLKVSDGIGREEASVSEVRLFPEQALRFPGANFIAFVPAGEEVTECTLQWRLYLDNAPPTSGSIKLALEGFCSACFRRSFVAASLTRLPRCGSSRESDHYSGTSLRYSYWTGLHNQPGTAFARGLAVRFTSGPSPRASESPASGTDRLRELQRLLDQGLISREEYEAKRAQILNEL